MWKTSAPAEDTGHMVLKAGTQGGAGGGDRTSHMISRNDQFTASGSKLWLTSSQDITSASRG